MGAADEAPSSGAAERSQGRGAVFAADEVRSGRRAGDGSSAHVSGRVSTSTRTDRLIGAIENLDGEVNNLARADVISLLLWLIRVHLTHATHTRRRDGAVAHARAWSSTKAYLQGSS